MVGLLYHIHAERVLHVLFALPSSHSYHYIRSISGFKIYLIITILGTFDSLFTSIEHVPLFSLPH